MKTGDLVLVTLSPTKSITGRVSVLTDGGAWITLPCRSFGDGSGFGDYFIEDRQLTLLPGESRDR